MNIRILVVTAFMILVSLPPSLQASDKKKARMTDGCDPTNIELIHNKERLWSGATADLFSTYDHGIMGFGNRPDRPVLRLSRLLKSLEASPSSLVILHVCHGNQPITYSASKIYAQTPEVTLGLTRTDEIRIFELKTGSRSFKKRQKRVYKLEIR